MAESRPKPSAPPTPTVPEATRVSDEDRTRLSDVPQASIDRTEVKTGPAVPKQGHPAPVTRTLEEELLHELRHMNRTLNHITQGYRRYTLAFFSGIVRGLGAAIGATVVFAVFLAGFSRLDTTPLIGNYVKRIVGVVHNSAPGNSGNRVEFDPTAKNPFVDEGATIAVDSDPTGAAIFVDGKPSGRKTPVDDLPLEPGHHEIKLLLGDASATVAIDAKAGETFKLGAPKLSGGLSGNPAGTPVATPQ